MRERIGVVIRKELIQALREPRMRVLLFLPPMIQLIVFGFAVNLDVDHMHIAWMDMDRTPLSRELRAAFEGSGRFEVVSQPASEEDVQSALDRGEAQAVVRVLPNFEREVRRGHSTEIQVLTHVIPARYVVTIMKGVFLKGVGFRVLWGELGFLALYAVIIFFLATRKMKQKLV